MNTDMSIEYSDEQLAFNREGDNRLKNAIDAAMEDLNKPNIMTLDEFREYEPIFRKNAVDLMKQDPDINLKYNTLMHKWNYRVDIRKPVILVDNNNVVVMELPAMLNSTRPIDTTKSNAPDIFFNLGASDIPKYATGALRTFVQALFDSNADEKSARELMEKRNRVKAQMEHIHKLYSQPDNTVIQEEIKDTNTPIGDVLDECEWE